MCVWKWRRNVCVMNMKWKYEVSSNDNEISNNKMKMMNKMIMIIIMVMKILMTNMTVICNEYSM